MDSFGTDLVPESPQWWAARLHRAVHDRWRGAGYEVARLNNKLGTRPALRLLDAWMRGEPPMPPGASQEWVDSWAAFLRASRTNYAELVISSVSDRIVPLGWRTAADGDSDGDAEALRVATETGLVITGADAIEDMLALGNGYLLVGKVDGQVAITREHPQHTIVAKSRATGKPRAGLRTLVDEWTGDDEHWLYLADGTVRVARRQPSTGVFVFGEPSRIPGGMFPLVELTNRRGVGDFERHLDTLRRINDTMFTRIVLTKMQAHRQRAVEKPAEKPGEEVEYEIEPEDFIAGPDAVWDLPPGVKIWESATGDFGPVRLMVQDDVKALCATTGTPLADMVPDAANQSAKGTDAVTEKHFNRVLDRQRRVDAAFSNVLALAFAARGAAGDELRTDPTKIQTLWAPIQRFSVTEKAQAASQLKGVWPRARIATDVMQARPSEVPQILADLTEDQMLYEQQQP